MFLFDTLNTARIADDARNGSILRKALFQISKIPLAQCTQHKKEKSNGAKYYDFSGFYNKKCKMLNGNERTHTLIGKNVFLTFLC